MIILKTFFRIKQSFFASTLFVLCLLLGLFHSIPSWSMNEDSDSVHKSSLARSLVFLDTDQRKDVLNFLYTKYEKHISIIQESKKILYEEDCESIFSLLVPNKYPNKEKTIDALMQFISAGVYTPELCELSGLSAEQIKTREIDNINKRFGSNLNSDLEYLIYYRKKDPGRSIAEDIVIGAQQLDHLQLTQGLAPILFLGRTPCFLQVAYKELCKFYYPTRFKEPHILHLNFSGTPDTENLREQLNTLDKDKIIERNLVTSEKLQFYCKYMDNKNMNSVKEKLYLVDMIGTGSSLNSFLRVMRYYYETYLGREKIPDAHFVFLNHKNNSKLKGQAYVFDSSTEEITFNSFSEYGVRPLRIKTTPLYLSETTLSQLDYPFIQACANHGISFPPQKWRAESIVNLNKGTLSYKRAYRVLRPILKDILKMHDDFLNTFGSGSFNQESKRLFLRNNIEKISKTPFQRLQDLLIEYEDFEDEIIYATSRNEEDFFDRLLKSLTPSTELREYLYGALEDFLQEDTSFKNQTTISLLNSPAGKALRQKIGGDQSNIDFWTLLKISPKTNILFNDLEEVESAKNLDLAHKRFIYIVRNWLLVKALLNEREIPGCTSVVLAPLPPKNIWEELQNPQSSLFNFNYATEIVSQLSCYGMGLYKDIRDLKNPLHSLIKQGCFKSWGDLLGSLYDLNELSKDDLSEILKQELSTISVAHIGIQISSYLQQLQDADERFQAYKPIYEEIARNIETAGEVIEIKDSLWGSGLDWYIDTLLSQCINGFTQEIGKNKITILPNLDSAQILYTKLYNLASPEEKEKLDKIMKLK